MHQKIKKIIIFILLLLINTVNSKTFTIQSTLLDSFTYSENISLIIPSISFSKTFDNNSTLKNNLELEKSSVMPNKENSTVIILGHSGYNFNAYFNDLFDLKKGDFTDEEVENAKKGIIASIKTIDDEQDTEITYFFSQELSKSKCNIEQYMHRISEVTKDKVVDIANKVSINIPNISNLIMSPTYVIGKNICVIIISL